MRTFGSVVWVLALGLALSGLPACGGDDAPRMAQPVGTDFGNAEDPLASPGIDNPDNPASPSAGSSAPPANDALANGECARDVTEAKNRPLTIYTLFDDSGSMFPWWIPVTQAFIKFVHDPGSAGINVGLKFFGAECNAGFYATPDVPTGPIGPGSAQAMMIESVLGFHLPISGTATLPAVEGGLMAAQGYANAHPDEAVILLLVTDGSPSTCESTVDNVSQAAMGGLNGTPSIPMYVLGLGDINGLNALSQAGGTGDALVADPNNTDQVVQAMNAIRGLALPCDYALPDGASAGTTLINLEMTPSGGADAVVVPKVEGEAACDPSAGGWYYNDAGTRLVACAQTCTLFKGNAGGRVDVVLGCPTVELK